MTFKHQLTGHKRKKNLWSIKAGGTNEGIVGDLLHWRESALNLIAHELDGDAFWSSRSADLLRPQSPVGLHLAVLVKPFLEFVLDGSKTIESRFGARRFAPFGSVRSGDVILLKAAAGPVVGLCVVSRAWYFQLDAARLDGIRRRFGREMCVDSAFWESRRSASYATLLEVRQPRQFAQALPCPKRDRRGWVVLKSSQEQLEIGLQ